MNKLSFISILAGLTLALSACAPYVTRDNSDKFDGISGIRWNDCASLKKSVDELYALIHSPSPLEHVSDRFECGEVDVPQDYNNPEGEKLTIAVSRLKAKETEQGVVFTNPGGPGLEGRTLPVALEKTGMSELTKTHTLVGIDVRGTGGSSSLGCESLSNFEDAAVEFPDKESAVSYAHKIRESNRSCIDKDPEFYRNLTTQNIARDMNFIRAAMRLEKIKYFGISWGTELGIEFRSQFPDRVERMLLDSVVDLSGDAQKSLDDIVHAVEFFGYFFSTEMGFAALGFKPSDFVTRTMIVCNVYRNVGDVNRQWSDYIERSQTYPHAGSLRPPHPVSSSFPGLSTCTGWPLEPHPISLNKSVSSLQLVGHARETVTPVVWAKKAQKLIGGQLFIIDDDQHGSLALGSFADQAVEYLSTGTYMSK
ncbi:hypothetical protein GCM10022198_06790 [Klugiella xanthotipulae]|uniref:Pimeloyl-ACP methyl ester carboxylesterase n=1 Tax=Klugiella xanthotipulae TaxID=244735 RepID=A0A543HTG1_9MICO|nr:alpha/beta fold hydrolase [Klugiella xanthotipulae]TQM61554.1 pimeloyl-ACP methyl ester carboxylesterase [Klugiella xanthotipulae]